MTAANPRTANPQTASPILTVDLQQWRQGGDAAAQVCAAVDESLQKAGFLLVTGHGIDPFLPAALRAAAREFFALPAEVKAQYAVASAVADGSARVWRPTVTPRAPKHHRT